MWNQVAGIVSASSSSLCKASCKASYISFNSSLGAGLELPSSLPNSFFKKRSLKPKLVDIDTVKSLDIGLYQVGFSGQIFQ